MDEITFQQPQDSEPPKKLSAEKRKLLLVYIPIFLLFSLIVTTVIDEVAGESRAMDVLLSIVMNIFAFAWCRIDSRERGYELHRLFPFAIIIFGFLALIYYLFRSRGFRGGLVSTLWLLLYAVLSLAAVMIVALIIVIFLMVTGLISPEVFNK